MHVWCPLLCIICTHTFSQNCEMNSHGIHDTSKWNILHPKFVLQFFRDFSATGDMAFGVDVWPSVHAAIEDIVHGTIWWTHWWSNRKWWFSGPNIWYLDCSWRKCILWFVIACCISTCMNLSFSFIFYLPNDFYMM